jgi:ABC-type transporter Mla maintaining outer membrane lipid asymmetry ATPase subunit MlaF
MPSAFRIADRIAMLHQGIFRAVGTKDEIRASQDPHVRHFLDRVPEHMANATAVAADFEKYLHSQETHP